MEPVFISSSHEDLGENLHDTSTASLFTESAHRVVGRSRRAVCLRPPEKPRASCQSHLGPTYQCLGYKPIRVNNKQDAAPSREGETDVAPHAV